jgi:DNA-binding IclR family transcriptional regulator
VQEDVQEAVSRVLRALRAAHNMLSVEQIADQTGIDKGAVEAHLIGLRLRGLAHCTGHEFERDRRVKVVTWKAAPPDPA